jgi:hypothetical protein
MVQLTSPDYIGGRAAAADWLANLGSDLSGVRVDIDCSALVSTSPSFVDEVLKILVVDRGASLVKMKDVPLDVATWVDETLKRRSIADSVMVDIRAA